MINLNFYKYKFNIELVWVIFGQFAIFTGNLLSIKFLTNIMYTQDYGKLTLSLTFSSLVNMFVYGPINNYVIRFYPVFKERERVQRYFYILFRIVMIISVFILSMVLIVFITLWILHIFEWSLIVSFALLFSIVAGMNSVLIAIYSALRNQKLASIVRLLDIWIRLFLAVLLLILYKDKFENAALVLIGYIAGSICLLFVQSLIIFNNFESLSNYNISIQGDEVSEFRELFMFIQPFIAWAGLQFASLYGDRWVINFAFGANLVGIYVAIYQIASVPVTLIFGSISTYISPVLFNEVGSASSLYKFVKSIGILNKTALYSILIFIPIVFFCVFEGRFVLNITTSKEYSQYGYTLWVIVLALVFFQLGQTLSLVGTLLRKNSKYLPAYMLNVLVSIPLCYFLGRTHGISGITWAILLSNFLYLLEVLRTNSILYRKHKRNLLKIVATARN